MGWFDHKAIQTLSAMLFGGGKGASALFGRGKGLEYVQPGTAFRRIHDDELIETAEVESVATDPYGIPHVKFKVIFSRSNRFSYEEGTRMLALQSFTDRYKEQVPVVPA